MKAFEWLEDDGTTCTIPSIGHDDDGGGLLSSVDKARRRTLDLSGAEELAAQCPAGMALLDRLAVALDTFQAGDAPVREDLTGLDIRDRELIAQVLGEGEVTIDIAGSATVIESVLTGAWRVQTPLREHIEVATVPSVVRAALAANETRDFAIGEKPDGVMNALPVLAEIRERALAYRPGQRNHVISFTLLPMTEDDMDFLRACLGTGPVRIRSRGYGTCEIVATACRDVWSVQFFNAMDTVILDTLEIGDVPQAAQAAQEDFEDSAERLREIREAYL